VLPHAFRGGVDWAHPTTPDKPLDRSPGLALAFFGTAGRIPAAGTDTELNNPMAHRLSVLAPALIVTLFASARAFAQPRTGEPPRVSTDSAAAGGWAAGLTPSGSAKMPAAGEPVVLGGDGDALVEPRRPTGPYEHGQTIPPGYRLRSRGSLIVVTIGVSSVFLGYVFAGLAVGVAKGEHSSALALVPMAGPPLALALRTSPSSDAADSERQGDKLVRAALGVSSVLEIVGAGVILAGVAWRDWSIVRDERANVRVVPMRMGQAGTGIGVMGSF
jgi:hypothetical protein